MIRTLILVVALGALTGCSRDPAAALDGGAPPPDVATEGNLPSPPPDAATDGSRPVDPPPPGTSGGTVTLDETFESGSFSPTEFLAASLQGPHATADVVTGTALSGTHSAHFRLQGLVGDTRPSFRTEIPVTPTGSFTAGHSYCLRYHFMARGWNNPYNAFGIPSGYITMLQTHSGSGVPTPCAGARDSIAIIASVDGTVRVNVIKTPRSYPPGSGGGAISSQVAYATPFVQDAWYRFTLLFRPSFGADGIIDVYDGKRLVYSQRGGNVDLTDFCGQQIPRAGSQLKIGLYRNPNAAGANTPELGTQELYVDDLRIVEDPTSCGP